MREAINDVFHEGLLGTILPGLMILLFLRDLRSTHCSYHYPLVFDVVNSWSLAFVDRLSISDIERTGSIHRHPGGRSHGLYQHVHPPGPMVSKNPERSIKLVLRLWCQDYWRCLSVVAVFIPSFFMVGITRELFIPCL